MATRILVICKSHEVPGPKQERATLLANKTCQKVWARDFDESAGDRLITEGDISMFGIRCALIIDNGPIDSKDFITRGFRWKNGEL